MDLSFRFDAWWSLLPQSPADEGTVHRLVVRPEPGARITPDEVEVVAGKGVVGDSWEQREHAVPGSELSLINVHVLRSLAGGDEDRMPLSGDNLQVDLDLSEANLPPGTVLEVGSARLEVSDVPHRPCRSFHARFGGAGAKKVARANRRGRRGRGVLCHVRQGGRIRVGDTIRVVRPAES